MIRFDEQIIMFIVWIVHTFDTRMLPTPIIPYLLAWCFPSFSIFSSFVTARFTGVRSLIVAHMCTDKLIHGLQPLYNACRVQTNRKSTWRRFTFLFAVFFYYLTALLILLVFTRFAITMLFSSNLYPTSKTYVTFYVIA